MKKMNLNDDLNEALTILTNKLYNQLTVALGSSLQDDLWAAAPNGDIGENRCFYCGKRINVDDNNLTNSESYTFDRLIPASQGGLLLYPNVVLSHWECANERKELDKSQERKCLPASEYYEYRIQHNKPVLFPENYKLAIDSAIDDYANVDFDKESEYINDVREFEEVRDFLLFTRENYYKQIVDRKETIKRLLDLITEDYKIVMDKDLENLIRHDENKKTWEQLFMSTHVKQDELMNFIKEYNNTFNQSDIQNLNVEVLQAWLRQVDNQYEVLVDKVREMFTDPKLNLNKTSAVIKKELTNAGKTIEPYAAQVKEPIAKLAKKGSQTINKIMRDDHIQKYADKLGIKKSSPKETEQWDKHTWKYFLDKTSPLYSTVIPYYENDFFTVNQYKERQNGINHLKRMTSEVMQKEISDYDVIPFFKDEEQEVWHKIVKKCVDKFDNDDHSRCMKAANFIACFGLAPDVPMTKEQAPWKFEVMDDLTEEQKQELREQFFKDVKAETKAQSKTNKEDLPFYFLWWDDEQDKDDK